MWKNITEVSGRKNCSRCKDKVSSQEQRVKNLRKKQFEDLIIKLF